jgi:Transposase DDE domain group 1
LAGVEEAIGELACWAVGLLPAKRRAVLRAATATIDLDGTDVECYGSGKEGIAYTYKGQRAGRPHVATWAEAGLVTAADLLAGDEDPRPGAGSLIARSVATLRAAGVSARPRVRGDVGYFAADIAWAAVDNGCDFSLGVTRNKAAWRAAAAIADDAWTTAERMKGAQVAVADYAPAGWPAGTACVVRRVRVPAANISTDPRARRRRTIPKDQLALALDGQVDEVYAYSFIATNLDVSTPTKAAALEAWHRMRTDIEDRIRDAKHGAALRHLPSGDRAVNTVWMWGALLAVNMSAWLQELAGLDNGDGRGRAHLGTLRQRLLAVPARLVRHAGQTTLRLPPGKHLLAQVLARLRRLPIWT